ncbi:unnamed protein product [Allacma fusca]|uniref:Uncharacterized protein n=1 Tax=Allacma fusca TaxID=39272 RepID=A0A8J2LEY2_9HEXA|nr:unnamed protein product [Allacma fusca]
MDLIKQSPSDKYLLKSTDYNPHVSTYICKSCSSHHHCLTSGIQDDLVAVGSVLSRWMDAMPVIMTESSCFGSTNLKALTVIAFSYKLELTIFYTDATITMDSNHPWL